MRFVVVAILLVSACSPQPDVVAPSSSTSSQAVEEEAADADIEDEQFAVVRFSNPGIDAATARFSANVEILEPLLGILGAEVEVFGRDDDVRREFALEPGLDGLFGANIGDVLPRTSPAQVRVTVFLRAAGAKHHADETFVVVALPPRAGVAARVVAPESFLPASTDVRDSVEVRVQDGLPSQEHEGIGGDL